MQSRLRCTILGHVQGVGFRWAAAGKARDLGLSGLAQNLPDGAVEIIVEGSPDALREFEAWCYSGSKAASVVSVEVHREPAEGTFTGFSIT